MAFQRVPNCVEVTLNMTQDNIPVVNRWFVDVGHTVVHSDLTGVFAVVDAWVTSTLSSFHVTTIHYETIVVKNHDVANGEELVFVPTTLAGTNTQVPTANSTAMCASLRTALTGKNFRGRTYIGGVSRNYLADSTHIVPSGAVQVANIMTDLVNALNTATYTLVVVSRFLNNAKRVVAVATEIVTVIVDTVMDVQRRRTAN